jgi:hypothetical protein
MSDPSPAQPLPSPRRRKRWLFLALGGAILIATVAFLTAKTANDDEADASPESAPIVYPIKHKPAPPTLGIEYHYDRNAIVDSRAFDKRIVGLTASGNLLAFDSDSFALRQEMVLHRRATCLGPADATHLFAGIFNGSIVRVSASNLALEHVADVPGVPLWIGRRAQAGALVVAYQTEPGPGESVLVRLVQDEGQGHTYDVGVKPVLFLDSRDRLWIASGEKVQRLELATSTRAYVPIKSGWAGVRGFAELSSGQVWAFGGTGGTGDRGDMRAFVARVSPGTQADILFPGTRRRPDQESGPTTPITHILESKDPPRLLVVSHDGVAVSDTGLGTFKPFDIMGSGHRDQDAEDAIVPMGQAHLLGQRIVLALERNGFLEVTADFTRRHRLDGQNTVFRPSQIVPLDSGVASYGYGGPLFYSAGSWHPLPEAIMPPAELTGASRPGEKDRQWAAVTTIPIEGGTSYVIAKAGTPRHYLGHLHGLRDVFLTARWDGSVLKVIGREDLPIEPDDTFATPDKELWNVDDQGLWSFSGGHWHLVMRFSSENPGVGGRPGASTPATGSTLSALRSGIGERLHFRESLSSPFYGLPSAASSWALIRLDSNEAGGMPLIDEVPVNLAGRRLLLRDLSAWGVEKDELLLATDHGLCIFNAKWGTCDLMKPEGLDGEVGLFMRDGTKRLWLGGRGLWVLRDRKQADAMHPAIPMLADTHVVALAEAPDGRLVIGTEDRGTIFVTIPTGGFQGPRGATDALPEWERTRPHESSFLDQGVVLRLCRGKTDKTPDSVTSKLVADLRALAPSLGLRARVSAEHVFESKPDIVVRGAEPKKILEEVLPLIDKLENKARFSVHKRFGPLGSATVEVKPCPAP